MYHQQDHIDTEDLQYIFKQPWSITESEWDLSAQKAYDEALANIQQKIDKATEDGFTRLWKTEDGLAIAALGFFKVDHKKYETFFIASHHMDQHARRISIDLRNILKEKEATTYKGCTCRLYSASTHPKQVAWFEFIGFSYIPSGNIGNCKYFEYASIPEISKT